MGRTIVFPQIQAEALDAQRTKMPLFNLRVPHAFAQVDLGLRCLLTESMDTVVYVGEQRNAQVRLHGCARSFAPSLYIYAIRVFSPRCAIFDIQLPVYPKEWHILSSSITCLSTYHVG